MKPLHLVKLAKSKEEIKFPNRKSETFFVCLFVCFIYLVLKHSFDSRLSQDLYGNENI